MDKKFKNTLLITFISSIVLIIAFSIFSISNIKDLIHDQEQKSHTNEVLFNLEQVISQIKDAETGQRGFLLTGNREFLDDYYGAYERTRNNIDEVDKLTEDNVSQQMRLDSLSKFVEIRFGELEERLKLDFTPQNDAKNQELLALGKQSMDRIRDIIMRMENYETELLSYRTTNAKESIDSTFIILSVFTVLVVIIIITSFSFTLNEFQRRSRTEHELQETVENLEYSNENLEQFAYVASHDLQEPLRKIQAFGNLLKSEAGDSLSQTAAQYVDRMQNASGRMQLLINELLNFSRASRNAEQFENVVLRKKINNAIFDLEIAIKEANAKIDLDLSSEIEFRGNKTQLSQLFLNLIGNAIKFRKEGVDPVINIVGRNYDVRENKYGFKLKPNTEYFEVTVSDNGIGFDEKYMDKIFTIFQRLHPKMQYKGTGIGLALCKKIVSNHGGFITAKSKPGEGATFIMIFPKKLN